MSHNSLWPALCMCMQAIMSFTIIMSSTLQCSTSLVAHVILLIQKHLTHPRILPFMWRLNAPFCFFQLFEYLTYRLSWLTHKLSHVAEVRVVKFNGNSSQRGSQCVATALLVVWFQTGIFDVGKQRSPDVYTHKCLLNLCYAC